MEEVNRIASLMRSAKSGIACETDGEAGRAADGGGGRRCVPDATELMLEPQPEQHLRGVQSILAGQFVTDVDEKNASAMRGSGGPIRMRR